MAGTAFTSVALTGTAKAFSSDGLKVICGTAKGPSTAGADTTLDVGSFCNGKVKNLEVTAISGTAFYSPQPIIGDGTPATVKVNIFSGTSVVGQSSADLSAVDFSWVAIVSDYE
jgi:hypothetical protein